VPDRVRLALKVRRITTCEQLLASAGNAWARAALARAAQIDPDLLDRLVQHADMARVNGIGVVFGLMLEALGVREIAVLAHCDPQRLHDRLCRYNQRERLARRSPTPEEVAAWVAQARLLPLLLTRANGESTAAQTTLGWRRPRTSPMP
jgi:predicted flap endonuclease-1-like 5' DNA nuclease